MDKAGGNVPLTVADVRKHGAHEILAPGLAWSACTFGRQEYWTSVRAR